MSKVSDIQDKIEIIQNICLRLGGNLSGIEMTANVAADEIENEGQITQETCMAMATMMKAGEDDALKLFTGKKLASITQKKLKELLSYDPKTGIFVWKRRPLEMFKTLRAWKTWNTRYCGEIAGSIKRGYCHIRIYEKGHLAHRLAWLYVYGEYPEEDTDHINHRSGDNRIANLRSVTHEENLKNKGIPKNNKSGYMGVAWCKSRSRWVANISAEGRQIQLGRFKDLSVAIWVRQMSEIKYSFHENHGIINP